MEKKFSRYWRGSRQPRKQRKFIANAPFHLRRKLLSASLAKDLRKKYHKRNFPIRKGDTIKIISGKMKGKTGKVSLVDWKKLRIAIEGIQLTKKEGSKVNLFFSPSKIIITELVLDDKKRLDSINRGINKKENSMPEKINKKENPKEAK